MCRMNTITFMNVIRVNAASVVGHRKADPNLMCVWSVPLPSVDHSITSFATASSQMKIRYNTAHTVKVVKYNPVVAGHDGPLVKE